MTERRPAWVNDSFAGRWWWLKYRMWCHIWRIWYAVTDRRDYP